MISFVTIKKIKLVLQNFFILFGKNFIHKQKFSKSQPTFPHFLIEFDTFLKSLRLIKNKKVTDS